MWRAEFRIAFRSVGAQPKPGDQWRINLARHRAGKPGSRHDENLNIILSDRNHRPDLFAPLVFAAGS